ncbi:MAG: insulinase family protein [Candidatus Dormibacteria bacterium]
MSPERSSPTVGVGVFYRVGFRLEPEGRTGFAHLFEHLMFQGTPRVPKPHFGISSGLQNRKTPATIQGTQVLSGQFPSCLPLLF